MASGSPNVGAAGGGGGGGIKPQLVSNQMSHSIMKKCFKTCVIDFTNFFALIVFYLFLFLQLF